MKRDNVHPLRRPEVKPVTEFKSGCDYLGGGGAGLRSRNVLPQTTVPAELYEASIDGLPKTSERSEYRSAYDAMPTVARVGKRRPLPNLERRAELKIKPKTDINALGYKVLLVLCLLILFGMGFAGLASTTGMPSWL